MKAHYDSIHRISCYLTPNKKYEVLENRGVKDITFYIVDDEDDELCCWFTNDPTLRMADSQLQWQFTDDRYDVIIDSVVTGLTPEDRKELTEMLIAEGITE